MQRRAKAIRLKSDVSDQTCSKPAALELGAGTVPVPFFASASGVAWNERGSLEKDSSVPGIRRQTAMFASSGCESSRPPAKVPHYELIANLRGSRFDVLKPVFAHFGTPNRSPSP